VGKFRPKHLLLCPPPQKGNFKNPLVSKKLPPLNKSPQKREREKKGGGLPLEKEVKGTYSSLNSLAQAP